MDKHERVNIQRVLRVLTVYKRIINNLSDIAGKIIYFFVR